MIQAHVIFHGKVQGVFFRKCVFQHANHFLILGFVKNLPDGCVEAIFQGKKSDVKKLIDIIQSNPGRAEIEKVDCEFNKIKKEYSNFVIEYEE